MHNSFSGNICFEFSVLFLCSDASFYPANILILNNIHFQLLMSSALNWILNQRAICGMTRTVPIPAPTCVNILAISYDDDT
jgi:hypothetical protein